jgi:hypothetical protein
MRQQRNAGDNGWVVLQSIGDDLSQTGDERASQRRQRYRFDETVALEMEERAAQRLKRHH